VDWNGDGLLDIIFGRVTGKLNYYRRTGSGINDLTFEGYITANGEDIDVSKNAAPAIVDWNNDGLLDILIGNEYADQGIRLYLNSGTPGNPVLTTWSYVQSNEEIIKRRRCTPQVYDMNGDGRKDLIMGEHDGKVYYYENTGIDDMPVFSGYEAIQSNGSPILFYYDTRLWVNDWDEDGTPDILLSNYDGHIYMHIADKTGIREETVAISFAVSPVINPVNDYFSINIHAAGVAETAISIYDSSGRVVATQLAAGETDIVSISTSSMAVGVYTVVAVSGSETASCRTVLVK
jgi:hypothetical protein